MISKTPGIANMTVRFAVLPPRCTPLMYHVYKTVVETIEEEYLVDWPISTTRGPWIMSEVEGDGGTVEDDGELIVRVIKCIEVPAVVGCLVK